MQGLILLSVCRTAYANVDEASADRRPVDPPPVVELKILEGDAKNDITFSYNANFFLYTTLESARPIAPGRMSGVPATFPVLTGMPVAGMAYLDRPTAAGYFIFPDLSVRHEGKYRLSFNLFEELKESKDADAEPAITSPDHPNNKLLRSSPMAPQSHVHFRLEVKSEPFIVFSAKKFPGLAESTALSRVVAEQGCRVRIRRDVRMRRRDTKPNEKYDEYDEENGYPRSDRFITPDAYGQAPITDRPRSVSHSSVDPSTPYVSMDQRPSMQDMSYYNQSAYQQASATAPMPSSASGNYPSRLSFGSSSTPHYQTPVIPASNTAAPQPEQGYMQNGSSFQYPPNTHTRQMSVPENYSFQSGQAYQQTPYQPMQPYSGGNDYRAMTDCRQPSTPQSQPVYSPQSINPYSQVDAQASYIQPASYTQTITPSVPRAATPNGVQPLPPLKTLQPPPERKYEQPIAVASGSMSGMAPAASDYKSSQNGFAPYSIPAQTSHISAGTKRSYGKVFDDSHVNQTMHSGMRPDQAKQSQEVAQIEYEDGTLDDEDDFPNLKMLSYRRADGSRTHKKCPSPVA